MTDTRPGFSDLIRESLDARMLDVFVSIPGRVTAYDSAEQTATVQPVVKRPIERDDGTIAYEALPEIPNVPVAFAGAESLSIHFGLTAGDSVLLIFSQWSFARWRETGQISEPGDLRQHGPAYPIALPWYRPGGGPGADTDESIGKPGGLRVHFSLATVDVGAGTDFVAMSIPTQSIITAITALVAAVAAGPPATPVTNATLAAFLSGAFSSLATTLVASTNLKAD